VSTASTTGQSALLVRQTGAARRLRLNRPERRNALNPTLVQALDAGLTDAIADPGTAVVVLDGAGPSFCAGADLAYLAHLADRDRSPLPFLATVAEFCIRLAECSKPVVAAVHGHVVAGGLELILACDLVVAAEGTLIGDGHVRNGQLPAGGASLRLPAKLGDPLARRLMLTGELLPANDFLASGFVTAVLPPEEIDDWLAALVNRLAATAPGSSARIKRLLGPRPDASPEAVLATERAIFAEHWQQTDVAGALHAFVRHGTKG
jgi:enoyl-CoA hydratase/carnithine racemase